MIDVEKVIRLAIEAGAKMVYVWGASPKVDDMDIMMFTKLLIEEALNEQQADDRTGSDLRGEDHAAGIEGGQPDAGEQDLDLIQQRRKNRKSKGAETEVGIQDDH